VPAAPLRRPFDRSDHDPFEVTARGLRLSDLVDLDAVIQVTVGGTIVVYPEIPSSRLGLRKHWPPVRILETVVRSTAASYRMISGQVQTRSLMRVPRVVQLAISVEDIDDAIALLFGRLRGGNRARPIA
jgi:hypothetical protein